MQLINIQEIKKNFKSRLLTIWKEEDEKGNIVKKAGYEKDPEFTFRVSKPEFQLKNPNKYVPIEHTDLVECKYNELLDVLCKRAKIEPPEDGRYGKALRNKLLNDYNVLAADLNLADYKMVEWTEKHLDEIKPYKLKKGFFDIEVDGKDYEGFPSEEIAPCPINFISFVDNMDRIAYAYVLVNKQNKSMMNFVKQNSKASVWTSETVGWCKDYLDELNEQGMNIKDVVIEFYADEFDVIDAFYQNVHASQLDFLGAWNAYFDIKTIYNRLDQMDVNPTEVMCPSDIKEAYHQAYIKKDEFSTDKADIAHTFEITGWHHTIDLLYYYASIRKGSGKQDSLALNQVLLNELGESKYEYEGEISEAAYVNFEAFLKYSFYDSLRLMSLEEKNSDIDLMYTLSNETYTRINKVMRKTTCLRNLAYKYLKDEGYALSNNYNQYVDHVKKGKFKGAFVSDPNLVQRVGIKINGVNTNNVFDDVVDEDLESLYPSIILAFCIDSITLIGQMIDAYDVPPHIKDAIVNMFGDLICEGDLIAIGNKIFGLPNFEEILEALIEE